MKIPKILILFIFITQACSVADPVLCTEEFRVVGVRVGGDQFTDYFTVRRSTLDTFTVEGIQPGELSTWYPVLDDSYKEFLQYREETFDFVGLIDGIQVLRGVYDIRADRCHIELVSEEIFVLVD